jgi:hypothetical protein
MGDHRIDSIEAVPSGGDEPSLPCAASERGKTSGADIARTEPHSSVLTDSPCQSEGEG